VKEVGNRPKGPKKGLLISRMLQATNKRRGGVQDCGDLQARGIHLN